MTTALRFTRGIGRVLSFNFGLTSAVRQVSTGAAVISGTVSQIRRNAAPVRTDDKFEAAVARLGLTDKDLDRRASRHLLNKRVLLMVGCVVFGGLIAAIGTATIPLVIVLTPTLPMCFVLALKQQYRLTQIRERRLMSFAEFVGDHPTWIGQTLDFEV